MYLASIPYQAVKQIRSSCTGSGASEARCLSPLLILVWYKLFLPISTLFWGEVFFSWLGCCWGFLVLLVFFGVGLAFFSEGCFCFINCLRLWQFLLPFGQKGKCVSNVPDNITGVLSSLILSMKRRKTRKLNLYLLPGYLNGPSLEWGSRSEADLIFTDRVKKTGSCCTAQMMLSPIIKWCQPSQKFFHYPHKWDCISVILLQDILIGRT